MLAARADMTMEVEKAEERARVARAGQRAEAAGVGKRVEVRLAGCEGGGAGGEKASVKVLEATVRQGWWWRGWAGDRACRDVGGDGGGQGERTCRASARATVLGGENNGDGCA